MTNPNGPMTLDEFYEIRDIIAAKDAEIEKLRTEIAAAYAPATNPAMRDVLRRGEVGVEFTAEGGVVKMGDGRTAWIDLRPLPKAQPFLTETERNAILCGIDCIRDRLEGHDDCEELQATLRSLLERLGGTSE